MEAIWCGTRIHIRRSREKRDGKTAGLSDLNRHMLVQARKARNVSITSDLSRAIYFKLCARRAKSIPPDVTHMMNFTRLPRFSRASLKNWEESGDEAITKLFLS